MSLALTMTRDMIGSQGSKLVLGTAQFGMDYGVTNTRGRVSAAEVNAIFERAIQSGVTLVDTAPAYGVSEQVVGTFLKRIPALDAVTKTVHFDGDSITARDVAALRDSVALSLDRLGRPSLDAVLIHRAGDLRKPGGDAIWSALTDMQAQGIIRRCGVSIYDHDELDAILDRFDPTIVQVPLNVFDQRLVSSQRLDAMRARNIEIHARSIFLQGILLAGESRLSRYFFRYADVLLRYRRFLSDTGMSALCACLAYATQVAGADRIVVGVTSVDELDEILLGLATIPDQIPDFSCLAVSDPDLVDPRRWPVLKD